MIRTHGDVLGDTALDILVDVGCHPGTTVPQVARRLGFNVHSIWWHLRKPQLQERIEIVRHAGRRPARLQVRLSPTIEALAVPEQLGLL